MEQQEQKAKAPVRNPSQKPSRPLKKQSQKKKPAVQVKETDKSVTETATTKDEIVVVKAPKGPESKNTKPSKTEEPQSLNQNLYVLTIQNKKDNVADTYVSAKSFNEAIAKFYASEYYRKNNKSSILSIAQVNTFLTTFIS